MAVVISIKKCLLGESLGAQWFSPAFGPGHDPGVPGSSPTLGSLPHWEPASPSAWVSASVSLSLSIINK